MLILILSAVQDLNLSWKKATNWLTNSLSHLMILNCSWGWMKYSLWYFRIQSLILIFRGQLKILMYWSRVFHHKCSHYLRTAHSYSHFKRSKCTLNLCRLFLQLMYIVLYFSLDSIWNNKQALLTIKSLNKMKRIISKK